MEAKHFLLNAWQRDQESWSLSNKKHLFFAMTSGVVALLDRNEDTASHHYNSAEQALTYLAFTEKELCPQDSQNSTELKERRYVAYQADSDGGKTKERCNSRDECSHHERTCTGTQSTPRSPGCRGIGLFR